jgi:HNH endonuclease
MEHFLGYHNAEDGGPYFPNDKSKRAPTGVFFTAKGFRPDTLIGNKIWVIEGREVPRQYRIVSTGTITNAVLEKRPDHYRTSEKEDGLTIEFRVDEFNDPIEVTRYDWFRKLRENQQNFSYGFTRLSDPNNVKEIEAAWSTRGTIASSPALADVENILNDKTVDTTTKKRLVDARLGQGRFRDELEARWGNVCAVTGCKISSVLRASHIKAWRSSSDEERLDPNNGLLLAAHIDALFDCGLITFRDDGGMLISKQVTAQDKMTLQLGRSLSKILTNGEKKFLRHHRNNVFQDNR